MSSLLGVHAVEVPGTPERDFLTLADRLVTTGWAVTVTSPTPDGPLAHAGHPHLRLDVGGLGAGEGARAVASWPRARRLGRDHDVVYLNSTVCGRLLPALRTSRTVLHVHDVVDRVPRHWHQADVVLVPSKAVAERLDGLIVHVVPPPGEIGPDAYAAAIEALITPEAALRAGHA